MSLTRHRSLSKPDDEQLHVLPLYVVDDTDELGSKEGQEEKFRSGAIQVLNKYPCEVKVRAVPLLPCRRHGKKKKDDEPDAVNAKRDKKQKYLYQDTSRHVRDLRLDLVPMFNSAEAQLQSCQVSSTVLDNPYQNWQRRPDWINSWAEYSFMSLDRDPYKVDPDSTSLEDSRPSSRNLLNDPMSGYDPSRAHSVSPRSTFSNSSIDTQFSYPNNSYNFHSPLASPQRDNRPHSASPRATYCCVQNSFPDALDYQSYPGSAQQSHRSNLDNWWSSESKESMEAANWPTSPFRVPRGRPPSRTNQDSLPHTYLKPQTNKPSAFNLPSTAANEWRQDSPHQEGYRHYDQQRRWSEDPPKVEPIGEVTDMSENEECFKDPQVGGVSIALGHGSVLFECAKYEVHSTTALKKPDRTNPARISLVFYQHRNLNRSHHGWKEWEEKMRLRELGAAVPSPELPMPSSPRFFPLHPQDEGGTR